MISLSRFTLLSALWLISVYNFPFWTTVVSARNSEQISDIAFLLSAFSILVLTFNSLLALLTFRHTAKPIVISLLLLSAAATSFMWRFGIVIDKSVIQSVFETDWNEVSDLLSMRFLIGFALLGVVPATLISRLHVRLQPWSKELRIKFVTVVAGTLVSALLIWTFSAEYSSLLRNHRDLRFMLTPTNVINSLFGYLKQQGTPKPAKVASNAYRTADNPTNGKPSVLVLVIGETARAADFSLKDHERDTNPRLKKENIAYFPRVSACGTSTAISLPCMFSDLGEANYNPNKAQGRDNLLDTLTSSGIEVNWLDNNSGCKGICGRAVFEHLASRNIKGLCEGGECFDEILLPGLRERLAILKKDSVLVLHMKGSHGPAYYRRYPQQFESFTPTCKSVDLSRCPRGTIHNAYDNTIIYTDFIISEIIKALKTNEDSLNGALLYISDHGESLGENGLYLHGMPKLFAPREQVEIPMLAWFSKGFTKQKNLDLSCVKDNRKRAYSHDNLFHSVLGLFNVRTSFYTTSLDIFTMCRRGSFEQK